MKKAMAPSRRDRLRAMLADLKMPGSLEELDPILQQVDSAKLTAGEAMEALLAAQITLAITGGCRQRCVPVGCRP